MTCREITLLVRALLGPYPRAFVRVGKGGTEEVNKINIRRAEPVTGGDGAAADGKRIRFRCRDGEVDLLPDTAAPAAT
jgi:hypothetical protein